MSQALATALVAPLWQLTQQARWFSGRARGGKPTAVTLGPWLAASTPGPGIRSAILTVEYPTGEQHSYHIPLVFRPTGQPAEVLLQTQIDGASYQVTELSDDPQAAGLLLAALSQQSPGFTALRGDIPTGLAAQRYRGEQSNTSLFFGDRLLCKLFRRLEPGTNLDLELHRGLAGSGAVAELYGYWQTEQFDLAIFLEAFQDPKDGYVTACHAAQSGSSFQAAAHQLGATLAKVHAVLAESFSTKPGNPASLAAVLRQRYAAVLAELPELARFQDQVLASYAELSDSELLLQRIHGDCHLGQVLLTDGQWRYVDFEGEPLKSLAERRQLDTPWRDVAGMLRSFNYAAASAEDGAKDWLSDTRQAFLAGYGGQVETSLLRALEIDKACYEVLYETRNRPAMRAIPLDFLASQEGAP